MVERNLFYIDYLTGLPNRQYLYNCFSKKINEFIVLLLDIDNFKYINDTFGHKFGDDFLVVFANKLYELIGKHGMVITHNGDSFIVLLPRNNTGIIRNKVKLILKEMQGDYRIEDIEVIVSVSMGIHIPEENDSIDDVIRKAEVAMYEAKRKGKGQYCIFENEIGEKIKRKSTISEKLKRGIRNNEFYIHYQPIVNLRKNEITEVEALIRWKNEKLGLVSPAEFIPIAEEIGFIKELGYWVIRKVCEHIKEWKEKGIDLKVAINISPNQLEEEEFLNNFKEIIKGKSIDFNQIKFEITETQILKLEKENVKSLTELMDLGVDISLDDFGTGYSSIKNMAFFPISEIKIDKSFVDYVSKDDKIRNLILLVILTAHKLGYTVTAEGVEYKQQLDILLEYGCDKIQGYYFARPMDKLNIEQVVKQKEGGFIFV